MSNLQQSTPVAISGIKLFDYQEKAVEDLRAALRLHPPIHRPLLVLPTGAGKGTIACYMIHSAVARGKRVLFLVNRRGLVADLSKRLTRYGVEHGVIMANFGLNKPYLPVQVASVDTLHRRGKMPDADLIFIDECHFSVSPTFARVIAHYAGKPIIGMTATPVRADGRGLGDVFQRIVLGPSTAELMDRGFLVEAYAHVPNTPDLSAVRTVAGEYNQEQLAVVMDDNSITGDIVKHWITHGRGRPTILFAVNVKHSRHICERFIAAGVRAVHVDATTPDEIREQTWAKLASGEIEVACTVGIASYGWDCPPVSCAILARPTQSLALHLQQIGRILRTFQGKKDAAIFDHAGNIARHGMPDMPRVWSLEAKRRKNIGDQVPSVTQCRVCWMTYYSRSGVCPNCGTAPERREAEITEKPGELVEIGKRMACSKCKRDMPGAKAGDECRYSTGDALADRIIATIKRRELRGESTEELADALSASLPDVNAALLLLKDAGIITQIRVTFAYDSHPLHWFLRDRQAGCRGTAERVYKIVTLSKNPKIAEMQRIAEERKYKPGWIYHQMQKLKETHGQAD